MIQRVISGGQTGVDQAALFAAQFLGIQTGGWMPKDFKTLAGNRPEFANIFGMLEDKSSNYADRTEQNVISSDGTIRIAQDLLTAGEKCTKRFINLHDKPNLTIKVVYNKTYHFAGISYLDLMIHDDNIGKLQDFITKYGINTLNVAGNSEKTCLGIYHVAYQFLIKALK